VDYRRLVEPVTRRIDKPGGFHLMNRYGRNPWASLPGGRAVENDWTPALFSDFPVDW